MPIYEITAPNGRTYEIEGPEGATDAQVAAEVLRQFPEAGGTPSAPRASANRSAPETYRVLKRLVTQLYPHAKVTSDKRTPQHNREVGGVGNSYHLSGHGLDIVGLSPAEREELKAQLEGMGVQFDEFKFHRVRNGGWHLHMASTHVPDELFADMPEDATEAMGSQDLPSPVAEQVPRPPAKSQVAPVQGEDSSFFRMPDSWEQFGQGIAQGTGDVVEGLADIPGIVMDPLNTVIGRGMGYEGYTGDFGKTVREGLGLPRSPGLTHDVIAGGAGGLGAAGIGRALAKLGTGAVAQGLREMGSTPIRDAVGGASAAAASGLAQEAGAPVPLQVAAGLAGGAGSMLGLQKAARAAPRVLDTRMGERIMPKLAQQRFEAQQARNAYRPYDREIASDLDRVIAHYTALTSAKAKLTKAQKATISSRLADLEASYLPYDDIKNSGLLPSERARLTKALDERHLLGEDDIAAIDDGTVAGKAVAEAIRKARRLRARLPEAAEKASPPVRAFLAEAAGGSLGWKLGGPIGGAAGSALARRLAHVQARASADKALELARQAPKFAKMPEETFGSPATARQALAKLADQARDAPFLAKHEAAAAKLQKIAEAALARQQARDMAEKLQSENRRVGVINDRDDVRPGGGFRGNVYEKTGLLPSQQDIGALSALSQGKLSPAQFQAFLDAPDKLMPGNAGNALIDRLNAYADSGKLKRDPKWSPPEAPQASALMVDAQGQPIRSWPAYQAGAAKNIARENDLLRQLDEIDPVRGQFGDQGRPIRASELGQLDSATAARAAAIRAQLAALKPSAKGSGE